MRYATLEKKEKIIDKTVGEVDRAFDSLQQVEKRIESCARQTTDMPEQVSNLRQDINQIMENMPRIKDAIAKLESLDSIIEETNKHFDELKSSQEWLGRTETRLKDLDKRSSDNLSLLGKLANEASSSSDSHAPNVQLKENIKRLKKLGWTNEAISEKLGVPLGVVEMTLGL